MSSATSSTVKETLAAYLASRAKAERVVAEVAAAYYGEGGRGKGDELRPIIEVIERAHPGVIELASAADRPGYAIRLAERPFPREFDASLRAAVERVVAGSPSAVIPAAPMQSSGGFFNRIVRAIRRVFS